jgi:alkanesulfonate monooxygenase SsuD/methylene tetrahydromethanopterin reductase-like flavin-dependent oxidoreductase (luciferase family)
VAPDLTQAETDLIVGARAAAYLSGVGYGELLVEANQWDPASLDDLRNAVTAAQLTNQSLPNPLSGREFFVAPARSLPQHWFEEGAAMGSAQAVAHRIHDYLDAGADEVILHGTTPEGLQATVSEFEKIGR